MAERTAVAERTAGAVPVVAADNVQKWFGRNHVLRGIDLGVGEGEVVCLIGASGSGKSTFLRCINHLETVDSGSIRVAGHLVGYRENNGHLYEAPQREINQRRAEIGMVFQHFNLFPHLSVIDNICRAPVKVLRRPADEVREQARELLASVGLSDKARSYPSELSGGQQQRVAIARALAMRPRLMLFDEPTSALDPELVGDVLAVMQDLASSGMTMIVVTHEIGFARKVADRIAFIDEGRVAEIGAPGTVLADPANARLRTFLSKVL